VPKKSNTKAPEVTVGGLRIVEMALDLLVPDPDNPRITLKPGDPGYEALAASLERFGMTEPVVWNQTTGYLVSGHQRVEVLRAQGKTTAPVSIVEMPATEARALGLALNKVSGEWDDAKLVGVLMDLHKEMDLLATGFTVNELAELTASLDAQTPALPEPAFAPSLEPKVAKSGVTAKDVKQAEQAQASKYVGGREPKDITCPNCAYVFGIGGWLKDYVEETEKLQAAAKE
jgi:ParB-like chromosome segregation protein Spo0J